MPKQVEETKTVAAGIWFLVAAGIFLTILNCVLIELILLLLLLVFLSALLLNCVLIELIIV